MTPEEKLEQIERKLKAALAELEIQPDALLFLDAECRDGRDYDLKKSILGLPIFYNRQVRNPTYSSRVPGEIVPWIPVWNKPETYSYFHFNDAYVLTD